ncbi:MAG: hypothetical protein IT287_08895 [Bdellovibrionaceae bacterium]|nr:hypothetical protein [Pseudobdellovibrionaceae bacterium]
MGLTRPLKLMLVMLVLSTCGYSVAFAQVQGAQSFSNTFDYSDALYESNPGQLEVLWRARIYGESTSLQTQAAEVGGADLFAEAKYQLLETTEARVFVRAKFEAGRSQSFFGDIEPSNGLLLREAAIKTSPVEVLSVKAGVINQDWLEMPLLLFRQSFPGANVDLHYNKIEKLKFGYAGQYLIPTSQTLSSRTVDREESPNLVTHTLYANYGDDTNYSFFASANTFDYDKLPSQVAFESQKTGNSFAFIGGANNSAFTYDFKGWFTRVGGWYRINSLWEPSAEYSVLKNEEAPESFNDGAVVRVGSRFHLTNHIVGIGYDNYFAESDVAPSYYNAWAYGNTNKKGNGGEISLEFKKLNFRVRAQYYDAKVINFNGLQQDQKYFFLGVETGYDKI